MLLLRLGSPAAEGSLLLSGEDSSPGTSDSSCNRPDRRTRRREKNREAAQKSRKKQTERADTLHKVTDSRPVRLIDRSRWVIGGGGAA
nr:PREDICTED: basic leucine zipper transcriptional factor ATF-like 3 [Lepisosteus oculatus]